MQHPLLALAEAYDRAVPPSPGSGSLSACIARRLIKAPRDALDAYAAHFSVLTQACQLGRHGILEEPQTDALYGLLASSFWHAGVLDDAYLASTEAAGEERDEAVTRKRYWVHQSKTQEAETGFDFGIVTPCGGRLVKVTLFQAKRPAQDQDPKKISLAHMVRKASRMTLHEHCAAWKQSRDKLVHQIREAKAKAKEQPGLLRTLQGKKNKLRHEAEHWNDDAGPRAQLAAIATIREAFAGGATVAEALRFFDDSAEFAEDASRCGEDSLFRAPYSYRQCDAFLATAIRGWRAPGAKTLPGGWCHYAQWLNRGTGEPWSVPLERAFALSGAGRDDTHRRPFAAVLTAALSATDRTVGLIVTEKDLRDLTGAIMSDLPALVWGSGANRPEIARDLLHQCGVPAAEIVPEIGLPAPPVVVGVQQPGNDLGPAKGKSRSPDGP